MTRADLIALAARVEQAIRKEFTPKATPMFLDMADSYSNTLEWSDPPGLWKCSSGPKSRPYASPLTKGEKPGGPTHHSVVWGHTALRGQTFDTPSEVAAALRARAEDLPHG